MLRIFNNGSECLERGGGQWLAEDKRRRRHFCGFGGGECIRKALGMCWVYPIRTVTWVTELAEGDSCSQSVTPDMWLRLLRLIEFCHLF